MSRYADDDGWQNPERERDYRDRYGYHHAPHSGLGIASCIIALCVMLFGVILLTIDRLMEASRPGGIKEDSAEAMVIGFLVFLDLGAALVGLVLGIVGAAMGNRNKLFAGLGIGINGL